VEKDIQFSIRLPNGLYRKLNFIAADKDVSRNRLITGYLQAAVEEAQIEIPSSLSFRKEPQPQ
jgi:predicted HicB family RNase H-like nuclease